MKNIMVPFTTDTFIGSFNSAWAAAHTFEQFVEEHKHNALTEGELRAAYNACLEAAGVTPEGVPSKNANKSASK